MKRTRLKKKSDRQKWIDECLDMLRKILKAERGAKCEICGRPESQLPFPLSNFHILSRQKYPRIQLLRLNILLACFSPYSYDTRFCHNIWHHLAGDDPDYQRVVQRVKQLRGANYRKKLLIAESLAPKLSLSEIKIYRLAFKEEVRRLGL